jgi:hypothetical protein
VRILKDNGTKVTRKLQRFEQPKGVRSVSENEHCWVMGMLLIQGQPFNINFKQQANKKKRVSWIYFSI